MNFVDFRIDLDPPLQSAISELKGATDAEIKDILQNVFDFAPEEMRKLMDTASRSGNTGYRVGGGSFTRSAIGEIPAKDSFDLYNSLEAEMAGDKSVILRFTNHAFYLDPEFEGQGGSAGYLNRPFIAEGLENAVRRLESL